MDLPTVHCSHQGTFYLMTNDCIVTSSIKITIITGFLGSALLKETSLVPKSTPGNAMTFSLNAKTYLIFRLKVSCLYIPSGLDQGALPNQFEGGSVNIELPFNLMFSPSTDLWPVTKPHLPLRLSHRSPNVSDMSNLIICMLYINYYEPL